MLELRDFQDEGVDWLKKEPTRLMAWEAGSGKTPPAVTACQELMAHRVLVLCPPIATGVWHRHFRDWTSYSDIRVLEPGVNPRDWVKGGGARIVPYSQISRMNPVIEALKALEWDVVIGDETHGLKDVNAIRTQQVYGEKFDRMKGITQRATAVWALTGTPILNHAADFWPTVHALAPGIITIQNGKPLTYDQYVERFCVAKQTAFGWRIVGSKRTHELHERLKPFMSRKLKKDVLKDLPPILFSEYVLPDNIALSVEAKAELKRLTSGLENLSDEDFLAACAAGTVHMATVRRLIGEAKVDPVSDIVHDIIASDPIQKVIVFYHHRNVGAALHANLKRHGVIQIDGSTSTKWDANLLCSERDRLVLRFQNNPDCRVALLNIVSAGVSATLTASSNVLFCEASWVPNDNNQAAARAHRYGQTRKVNARFITLPGTIDERIQSVLARKSGEIEQILDPV